MIKIGNYTIGPGYPCFIIAEAGVNHNGKVSLAKKLIRIAKEARADAVKFQAYKTEELVTRTSPKANYQKSVLQDKSQFIMLKQLELSAIQLKELSEYCQSIGIIFLCTAFDPKSAELLHKMNVPAMKIGSGEITDIHLLRQIAGYKVPILLSTGMSDLREVENAVHIIKRNGNNDIILLHCTSNYPTCIEDVNLRAMLTLRNEFNLPVGYSDHTIGSDISMAAIAMGASIIEKHFTFDKKSVGPDHKASLEGYELKKFVLKIREIELALGDGVKNPRRSELNVKQTIRKSIVSNMYIGKNTILSSKMLTVKRPGTGISPEYIDKLYGKKVINPIKKDQILRWKDVIL